MTDKTIYFGTRDRMKWVKAPAINANLNTVGRAASVTFLNGGGGVDRSALGHAEYEFNWKIASNAEIHAITDYYSGVFGKPPFYFVDPFAMETNLLPPYWAAPGLFEAGGPSLRRGVEPDIYTVPPDAGYGPVTRTNLATNPSFEATSGTVEVRRNHFSNPRGAVGTGWPSPGANSTVTFSGPGALVTHTSGAAYGNAFVRVPLTGLSPSTTYSVRYEVMQVTGTVALVGRVVDAFTTIQMATVTKSDSRIVLTATFTTGATLPAAPFLLVEFLGAGAGEQFRVVGGVCEAGVALPGNFDGSTSPDSDLIPSWTGTANASVSVLTGVAVSGFNDGFPERARRFLSQQWAAHGARSIRVVPLSADPLVTYAEYMRSGLTVGRTYTLIGTIRLAAPQTGPLSADPSRPARGFWVTGGTPNPAVTHTRTAPNTAGAHEVRATFVATATQHGIRLMNGAAVGGGDVWWDDLAIFEGVHTGPYFDGSTPATPTHVYGWTGAANASTSIERVVAEGGLPVRGARYTLSAGAVSERFHLPVPPGYTAHFGWFGRVVSGTSIIKVNGSTVAPNGAGVSFTTTATGSLTLTTSGTGTVEIDAMHIRMAPTGSPAPTGPWVPGQGHSGVDFAEIPSIAGISAYHDKQSTSVRLIEVGAWL